MEIVDEAAVVVVVGDGVGVDVAVVIAGVNERRLRLNDLHG